MPRTMSITNRKRDRGSSSVCVGSLKNSINNNNNSSSSTQKKHHKLHQETPNTQEHRLCCIAIHIAVQISFKICAQVNGKPNNPHRKEGNHDHTNTINNELFCHEHIRQDGCIRGKPFTPSTARRRHTTTETWRKKGETRQGRQRKQLPRGIPQKMLSDLMKIQQQEQSVCLGSSPV